MKVLMLAWEFAPFIAGGLGMACYGLVKALLQQQVEILLVLPTEKFIYFHLINPEDADYLIPTFMDKKNQVQYEAKDFESLEDRFKFLGLSANPEAYQSLPETSRLSAVFESYKSENLLEQDSALCLLLRSLESKDKAILKTKEYAGRLARMAHNLDFDLIHAHDWPTYPAGAILKDMTGKPLILHVHATEFDRAAGIGNNRIHNIEYFGLSLADQVIAVSHYTSSIIVDRYTIKPEKIKVIHNAFQIDRKKYSRMRVFRDPVILFLGRLTRQKGPDIFLEVAKKVIEEKPNVRFIMAGAGDMEKALIHKSANYRLKTNFLFAGFLNRKDVGRILDASDIILLPSISEPFGITPLEAMSYGIPAIISKHSGVSEIVGNVFKVDSRDVDSMVRTTLELLNNPQMRKEMGLAGAREVVCVAWDQAAALAQKAYEEILCST